MPQPVQYRGMALIVPDNDSEWKEFYEHARAHRLVVRKCKACGLMTALIAIFSTVARP